MSHLVPIDDKVKDIAVYCDTMSEAAARMCGGTKADGMAIALVCYQESISFLEFRRRYHLLDGRPTMRADAMLAEFRLNHGGDHRVVECSPNRVAVVLIDRHGDESEWSATWEEMAETRWPWKPCKKKGERIPIHLVPREERELKDNWSTPKDRETMMWARMISDALRKVCPELVAGVYTPEETADFEVVDVEENGEKPAMPTASEMLKPKEDSVGNPPNDTYAATEGEVVDAEYTVEDSQPEPPGQQFDDDGNPAQGNALASRTQLSRMRELVKELGVSAEKWNATLEKRGVATEDQLSFFDAKEIIERMEAVRGRK